MSYLLDTKSSFFYIDEIDSTNFYLDFDEGGGEISAEVQLGSYTHTDLAVAVESALNSYGADAYTVTFDRDLRRFVIASDGSFKLLGSTGTHLGTDILSVLGFTSDTVFAGSHTSQVQAGTEYAPQFWLQNYIPADHNQKSISPSVNKTANGTVEVVKFGNESFFEFNITLATDIDQGETGFIDSNPNGVADLVSFLRFCVKKNNLEFMPDKNTKASFFKVLIESTESESNGTGYKIMEMYDKGVPGYFDSGKLVFRLRE